jgi:hypothetical protein
MNQQHERFIDIEELVDDSECVVDEKIAFLFLFPPTLALIMIYMLTEMILESIGEWL